jgi:hypothetical protein
MEPARFLKYDKAPTAENPRRVDSFVMPAGERKRDRDAVMVFRMMKGYNTAAGIILALEKDDGAKTVTVATGEGIQNEIDNRYGAFFYEISWSLICENRYKAIKHDVACAINALYPGYEVRFASCAGFSCRTKGAERSTRPVGPPLYEQIARAFSLYMDSEPDDFELFHSVCDTVMGVTHERPPFAVKPCPREPSGAAR